MIKTYTKNHEERIVCSKVLRYLLKSHILESSHSILTHENIDGFSISYWTAPKQHEIDQTYFEIQTKDKTGYILTLRIKEGQKREGKGRILSQIIENIFTDLQCNRIRTTPSGEGKYFWPKMNFKPISNLELEKLI